MITKFLTAFFFLVFGLVFGDSKEPEFVSLRELEKNFPGTHGIEQIWNQDELKLLSSATVAIAYTVEFDIDKVPEARLGHYRLGKKIGEPLSRKNIKWFLSKDFLGGVVIDVVPCDIMIQFLSSDGTPLVEAWISYRQDNADEDIIAVYLEGAQGNRVEIGGSLKSLVIGLIKARKR
jgi:hypothetical protein